MFATKVKDFSEKYVPGSEITLTFSATGKYFSKLSLMTFATPVCYEVKIVIKARSS